MGIDRTVLLYTLVLFAPLSPGAAVAATDALGPVFRADVTPGYSDAGDPHGPAVSSGSTGRFVVVWPSDRESYHVRGRLYDGTGVAQGPDFDVVGSDLPQYARAPAVASLSSGDFLVVWQGIDGAREIFARRFASSGDADGDAFQVNTTGESGPESPKVAAVGDDGFVVVWGQYDYTGSIRGQRLGPDGDLAGTEFTVSGVGEQGYDAETEDHDDIDVAANEAGEFMVVWKGYSDPSGGQTIFARHFEASGQPSGSELELVDTTDGLAFGRHASVANDGDGNFVVVWSGRMGYGDYGIFGRRFDASGVALEDAFPIAARTSSDEEATHPEVSTGASGGFVVVWREDPYGGEPEVRGREFDASAAPAGDEFVLPKREPLEPAFAAMPEVTRDDSGDTVVAWVDLIELEILAQRRGTPNDPDCTSAPRIDCREPTSIRTSVFKILEGSQPSKRKILWRWARGEETLPLALGDPINETGFSLCVYDGSVETQPRLALPIPAGGLCGAAPCWEAGRGDDPSYRYSDKAASAGVRKLDLAPGGEGETKIQLLAHGTEVPAPELPLAMPVAVQLQATNGECWSADYGAFVSANESDRFIARSGNLF
jgi:hypothetical protein